MKFRIKIVKSTEKIPGGLGAKLTGSMEEKHQQIADEHGVSIEEIEAELKKGMEVEMEHTTDEDMAHEIAMDHLLEDPKYYTNLSKIEEKKKKKKKKKGKKDACYRKVKSRYDVWPSAYASGALVKCRKVGAKNWGNSKKNEELEHSVNEIELRGSLGTGEQVDVNWAAGKAEQVSQDKFEFGNRGIKLLVAPSGDHTKIIAYVDDQPSGYMAIAPFVDGVKVNTVSVKPEAKGKGVASAIYKYVIANNNLYSGDSQTPESKSLWQNYLARRYNVVAVDVKTKKELPSITDGVYTRAGAPKNSIYLMIKQTGGLSERKLAIDEKKKKSKSKRKKAGTESSKESSLRDWFKRKGAKGKKGGWVDCNAPDGKGGYKSCGRASGEKRKKYPSCRPTPGACKERGKGKSWGKKAKRGKKG